MPTICFTSGGCAVVSTSCAFGRPGRNAGQRYPTKFIDLNSGAELALLTGGSVERITVPQPDGRSIGKKMFLCKCASAAIDSALRSKTCAAKVGPGRLRASARRSALRADFPAMLGLVARRITRFVRCAHCARTDATSQLTMRAARAATSPALLGASQACCSLPGPAFAGPVFVFEREPPPVPRGRRCPAGAISVATRSAGLGSARAARIVN